MTRRTSNPPPTRPKSITARSLSPDAQLSFARVTAVTSLARSFIAARSSVVKPVDGVAVADAIRGSPYVGACRPRPERSQTTWHARRDRHVPQEMGPSAASALRECGPVHGRGHYGSSSGGRRLMSRAPRTRGLASASRRRLRSQTHDPLVPPRASLSRRTGAVFCAANSGRYARVATRDSTSHKAGRLVVGSNPTAGATRIRNPTG